MNPTELIYRPHPDETVPDRDTRLLLFRASLKLSNTELHWWHENSDDYAPVKKPVDQHRHITDTFRELPRLIYRLVDVEGLSESEVAAITAQRPNRVRKSLARAREMLRARLAC